MDTDGIPDIEYLKRSILGGRQYCLKEPLTTLPKARRQLKVYVFYFEFSNNFFFIFY